MNSNDQKVEFRELYNELIQMADRMYNAKSSNFDMTGVDYKLVRLCKLLEQRVQYLETMLQAHATAFQLTNAKIAALAETSQEQKPICLDLMNGTMQITIEVKKKADDENSKD